MMLFLLCSIVRLIAQDSLRVNDTTAAFPDSTLVVEQVIITGNENTKEFVILREMALKPGSFITQELLDYDKNRIYSLGLFTRVQLQAVPSSGNKAILLVSVNERWFIYPYPIFGIKDRDWGKLYYGLGLIHMNFRGRNEKLIASVAVGYDPWVSLTYRNPFLIEDGSYFIEGRFVFNKIKNKSLSAQTTHDNFDEQHFAISTAFGKRWGTAHTAWLTVSYEIVDVEDRLPPPTIGADGKDEFPAIGLNYAFDTRDLMEYPNTGTYARFTLTKYGIPSRELDIVRYSADLRRYQPLNSDFVLQGRVFTNLVAAGRTPSYNRVYFGYDERIRGHFKETMEGESIFGTSAELHYPLLAPRYFTVDFLPPQFGVWKFGITAAAFADAGMVWFRGTPLALNRFTKGYGVGIHFLLPYSAVLRTEYAWNEFREGQFIFDVGATF